MTSQALAKFENIFTDPDPLGTFVSVVTTNHLLPGTLGAAIRVHIDSEKEQLTIPAEEIQSIQLKRGQMDIASHRDLPTEILSKIFVCSLAEWGVPIPRSGIHTPWNLIRVCSLWRQLALNLPELWARVDLRIMRVDSIGPNIRAVQEVISASKNRPLSIRAYFSPLGRSVARQMIDIIFSDAHRLREISLRGHLSCIEPFLNLPAGLTESLEIVTLNVPNVIIGVGGTDLSVLKGSAKLRELTIDIVMLYSSIFQLPLAQLTALHLPRSYLHPRAALSILRQCPSIIQCTLCLSNHGDDALPDTTPCLLPELTHLTLLPWNQGHFDYSRCIELSLVLPRITHFYLKYFYLDRPWPAPCTQWITQSGTLQILHVDIPISSLHIEKLIRASPLLTELSVPRCTFSASCLEGVATGALLPKVRKLSCMVDNLDSFYAHLDMLERRKSDSSHAAHIAEMMFMTKSSLKESQLGESARYKEMRSGWKISVMRIMNGAML